ncbi:hypothetical protein [Microbacterium sp. NPDC055665]
MMNTVLTERIRELIERIDINPDVSVALEDVASVDEWTMALTGGGLPELCETFATGVHSLLTARYPATLPFPYARLPLIAAHEGWWDDSDGIPRSAALQILETGGAGPAAALQDPHAQSALLRAMVETTIATIRAAHDHPTYSN